MDVWKFETSFDTSAHLCPSASQFSFSLSHRFNFTKSEEENVLSIRDRESCLKRTPLHVLQPHKNTSQCIDPTRPSKNGTTSTQSASEQVWLKYYGDHNIIRWLVKSWLTSACPLGTPKRSKTSLQTGKFHEHHFPTMPWQKVSTKKALYENLRTHAHGKLSAQTLPKLVKPRFLVEQTSNHYDLDARNDHHHDELPHRPLVHTIVVALRDVSVLRFLHSNVLLVVSYARQVPVDGENGDLESSRTWRNKPMNNRRWKRRAVPLSPERSFPFE